MLISQISTLDSFMQNNDSAILELLTKDISFGHSNGWVQTYNDFQNDIESKKVEYKVVKGEDSPTIKIIKCSLIVVWRYKRNCNRRQP